MYRKFRSFALFALDFYLAVGIVKYLFDKRKSKSVAFLRVRGIALIKFVKYMLFDFAAHSYAVVSYLKYSFAVILLSIIFISPPSSVNFIAFDIKFCQICENNPSS